VDGGEKSDSHPSHFTPMVRAPGTDLVGSWVGLRAGLDTVAKRKSSIVALAMNGILVIYMARIISQGTQNWHVTVFSSVWYGLTVPQTVPHSIQVQWQFLLLSFSIPLTWGTLHKGESHPMKASTSTLVKLMLSFQVLSCICKYISWNYVGMCIHECD